MIRIPRTPLRRLLAPLLLALGAAAPLAAQEPAAPPLSLSDADGQQLTLETLSVRTATHGPLALTELEIRFRNPHGRRMEGRFSATLPEGATISRFAKEVNGELMEGEVVERLRANQVYDQILHQMRDPALLEQDQGNRFSARIFPIEAGATVRLVLGYSQLLPLRGGERSYTLPLRGMPRVGLFTFRGQFHALPGEQPGRYLLAASRPGGAPGVRVIERSDEQFTPDEDLEVRWRADDAAPAARVLSASGFYVASFRPTVAPRVASTRGGRWVFYVDASASAAEGAEHRVRALERLLAALPAGDSVELRAFDHHVTPLRRGTAAELARAVGPLLRERLFLGGTDLDGVIRTVAMDAARRPGDRHVLVTDGVATLGRTRPAELRAAAATIPTGAMVHALVLGARQDAPTLAMLTRGRGRVVAVPFSDALDRRAAEAAARLALPAGASFAAADEGAEWVLASGDGDVQPGDEVVVVGRLRPGSRPAPRLVGSTGGTLAAAGVDALPAGRFAPLLEREAMRAWLAELAEREAAAPTDSARRALVEEQVRLSVEHRVMIPRTTMLVLETEEDYQRFGLDRRGLSSILTVGVQGVELLRREPRKLAGEVPPAPAGPGVIVGRVVDAANGSPLAGVTVVVEGSSRRVVTDAQGRFRLDGVAVGPQQLRAARIGYGTRAQRVRVDERRGATVDFRLPSSTVQLEAITATGAANPRAAEAARSGEERQVRAEDFSGPGRVGGVANGVEAGVAQDAAAAPPPPPAMAPPPMPMPAPEEPAAVRGQQELVPPAVAPPPPTPVRPGALQGRSAGVVSGAPVQAGPPPRPQAPEWTRRVLPSRAQVDSLAAALAAEPRRRDLYNRLSEAQWALGEWAALRRTALAWQPYDPENPQVYEALGEAALRLGRREEAARAFGSLVEVAPARPELLQRAGLLLLRAGAAEVAVAPLRRSLEQRPDRANGYRHLALVLWQLGREGEAADLLEDAARRDFPDWYRDVNRVIREELGYVLRSWAAREPARRREIQGRAAEAGVDLERRDALRVTLAWETDANDVDLHVVDPENNHVFYGSRTAPTGLELYEDITQGFGPEVVRAARVVPGTYHVGVNYFSAGPMGVSRGVLVVMRPDVAGVARTVQILPFRLVEGGRDMRHLAEVVVP